MTPEFLNSTLEHLYERTKEGKQHWNVEMKTSEYKEESEKPVVEADGKQWVVDECYTAYSCEEHGNEFVMITYENIETCGEEVRSTNMVFLPGSKCSAILIWNWLASMQFFQARN